MKRNLFIAPLSLALAASLMACSGASSSSAAASAETSAEASAAESEQAAAEPTAEPTAAPEAEQSAASVGTDSSVTRSTQTVSAPQGTTWSGMADADNLPETLPLYFDFYYEGKTLQDVAEMSGYPLETLQALNPDLVDGVIENTQTVLLDDAFPLPEAQERVVCIVPNTGSDAGYDYDYAVPAWMDEDAAAVLGEAMDALSHLDESSGYWPADAVSEDTNLYCAQEGARFTSFAEYETYIDSLFTGDIKNRFFSDGANEYGNYFGYSEGDGGTLCFGAGDGGANILYLGCLFTEPDEQTDDTLSFTILSVYAADDALENFDAENWPAAKLGYHPVRMVKEADGWRVENATLPTMEYLNS